MPSIRVTAVVCAALAFACADRAFAQALANEPAYVVRGNQTAARHRALKERLARFHNALAEALKRQAPDLLPSLEPPPPAASGYGVLPRIVDAPPPPPPAKPQVVSYSWPWSDTLLAREAAALERLETELLRISTTGADRAAHQTLAADYRKAVDRLRPVSADIDYNWLWQAAIARDRSRFDRVNKRLQAVLDRQAIEDAPGGIALPSFVRIEHRAGHQWLFTVPLYTDITDARFIESFTTAVETLWHVRAASEEFRVRLAIQVLTPERLYCGVAAGTDARPAGCAPPARGDRVDLTAHTARFPKDGAVLTTGAASLRVTGGTALVLGPHDVAPRVLAHEFGHLLGMSDAYLRGYRDLGTDGFQVMELVPDAADIMSGPGSGMVLPRHFDELLAARDVQMSMNAGLDALYERNDPVAAVARFREALARKPTHYGGTLQLAKALDKAGRPEEALLWWKKILDMAEAADDAETARTARARLAPGR